MDGFRADLQDYFSSTHRVLKFEVEKFKWTLFLQEFESLRNTLGVLESENGCSKRKLQRDAFLIRIFKTMVQPKSV